MMELIVFSLNYAIPPQPEPWTRTPGAAKKARHPESKLSKRGTANRYTMPNRELTIHRSDLTVTIDQSPLIFWRVYRFPDEVVCCWRRRRGGWWTIFGVEQRRLCQILVLVPEEAAAAGPERGTLEGGRRLPGQAGRGGGDQRLQLHLAHLFPTRSLDRRRMPPPEIRREFIPVNYKV